MEEKKLFFKLFLLLFWNYVMCYEYIISPFKTSHILLPALFETHGIFSH